MHFPFVPSKKFLSYNDLVITSLDFGKLIQGTCDFYKVGKLYEDITIYFRQTSNVLEYTNG